MVIISIIDFMSLRSEIQANYVDAFGMVMPHPSNSDTQMGSDNGILFTAEYLIALAKRKELILEDKLQWTSIVSKCLNPYCNLKRGPYTDAQESVDDHYGLFAACKTLNMVGIPKFIKRAMFSNWGFSNNEAPGTIRHKDGTINWDAFLIRQPQLVAAMISASNEKRWYHLPLYLYTAIIIATSCMFTSVSDSTSRKLAWLLIQTVAPDSLLCRLAAKIWFKRLYKHYNSSDPMRIVYGIYFGFAHPLAKYGITK